ncbi:MAG: adenylate/guanylate cyclase domain-containing protein, partial [Acidobacteriota bacterium]
IDIDNLGVLVMVEAAGKRAAALAAVKAGLELRRLAEETGDALRAAVHAGPVVAGVVGHSTWRFGLWGGSVTLVQQACHSVTRGLHLTDTAWRLVQGRVLAEAAGGLPIEGGALPIFRVEGLS